MINLRQYLPFCVNMVNLLLRLNLHLIHNLHDVELSGGQMLNQVDSTESSLPNGPNDVVLGEICGGSLGLDGLLLLNDLFHELGVADELWIPERDDVVSWILLSKTLQTH